MNKKLRFTQAENKSRCATESTNSDTVSETVVKINNACCLYSSFLDNLRTIRSKEALFLCDKGAVEVKYGGAFFCSGAWSDVLEIV